MSKIRNNNHIVIDGWMVNELNLKGNDLIVYALIYGFSQDGDTEFYGSRSYMASWCNASLPTIDKAIQNLLDKNLILKKTEVINNVTFNKYKINLEVVKKIYMGSKESLLGVVKKLNRGSRETLNNNIDNNINNNIENITEEELKDIFDYNWLDDEGE